MGLLLYFVYGLPMAMVSLARAQVLGTGLAVVVHGLISCAVCRIFWINDQVHSWHWQAASFTTEPPGKSLFLFWAGLSNVILPLYWGSWFSWFKLRPIIPPAFLVLQVISGISWYISASITAWATLIINLLLYIYTYILLVLLPWRTMTNRVLERRRSESILAHKGPFKEVKWLLCLSLLNH